MAFCGKNRQRGLVPVLGRVVGPDGVITDPAALLVYESDGLTVHRATPSAVVLPRTTSEVSAVVRILSDAGIPFVARGAGTGLSGGAIALDGGVVISLARMNRILELDPENRRAVVEAGVINAALSRAAAPHGLYYAPDPSSQSACTIGGNVAENAGGPHCLKYGVTSDHLTGLVVVLPDGEVIELGGLGEGGAGEVGGYDLVGLFTGSEGTLGIATEIEVRLLPLPEGVETLLALFDRVEDASDAVSAIIAAGLLPAALELIDRETIRAVEASIFAAGLPTDLGAALVIEFDGAHAGLAADAIQAQELCLSAGAREITRARDSTERERLWQARKKAFGALGRLAPDLLVQDAVVPRSRLTEVVHATYEIAERHRLRISNVFHAGDGNLHPTILFDRRDPDQLVRVEAASREIMEQCIAVGGTITGEHGVGVDKLAYMELIHDDVVLDLMRDLRRLFDPLSLSNPGKLLPDRGRGEVDAGEPPSRRVAGIIDHAPMDLVISVGAEMTLGELGEYLTAARQWLPLDPPGGDSLTLGEVVLSAAAGPLREGYGTPRDQVLGLQLVTGDGRIIECGSRLMKNVAGYDLVKLVIGSGGTLGHLTRVDLRLRALPESDRTVAIGADSPSPLIELIGALRRSRLEPVALELLSPEVWRRITGDHEGWILLIRFQGNESAVASALAGCEALVGRSQARLVATPSIEADPARIWGALSELEASAPLVVRLADRPAELATTLGLARRLQDLDPGRIPVMAHAGAGIIRLPIDPAGGEPSPLPGVWATALQGVSASLGESRGTLRLVERGRGGYLVEGGRGKRPGRSRVEALESAIRKAFDPAGTLAGAQVESPVGVRWGE